MNASRRDCDAENQRRGNSLISFCYRFCRDFLNDMIIPNLRRLYESGARAESRGHILIPNKCCGLLQYFACLSFCWFSPPPLHGIFLADACFSFTGCFSRFCTDLTYIINLPVLNVCADCNLFAAVWHFFLETLHSHLTWPTFDPVDTLVGLFTRRFLTRSYFFIYFTLFQLFVIFSVCLKMRSEKIRTVIDSLFQQVGWKPNIWRTYQKSVWPLSAENIIEYDFMH